MKKKYWLLVLLPLLSVNHGFAQQKKDAYDFPVKPGTEAWKQFKTGQAMVDASQVPLEMLRSMSTAGLVETCLNYPLLSTMLAHNDLQTGFQAVASSFNEFQELLKRPDAGREVFKVYQKMDPKAMSAKAISEKGAFAFEFTYIELLLSQPAILEKLTPTERKLLLKEGFAKFKSKDNYLATFGGFGELTTALILGRILEKEGFSALYQPNKRTAAMQAFLVSGEVTDTQVINQIIADTQSFAK